MEPEEFKIPEFKSVENKVIERKKMGRILEAGRRAPSPGKRQTIEFVVVESDRKKQQIANLLGQPLVEEAPDIVVLLSSPERMGRTVDNPVEACYAESAATAQNMRIQASQLGIASNMYTGYDSRSMVELIGAPREKESLGVVTFAYTSRPIEMEPSFGMNEIAFYDEYDNQVQAFFDGFEWEGVEEESRKLSKKVRGLVQKVVSALQ